MGCDTVAETTADTAAPVVAIREISKTYSTQTESVAVLHNVRFSLYPGDFAVLQGPSGSGKSTLLHLLAGVLTPDDEAGSIALFGEELVGASDQRRRTLRWNHCGLVFQDPMLIAELTVLENVLLPSMSRAKASKDTVEALKEEAHSLLQAVGLAAHAERFPAQLSGGQKTRVSVARALMGSKQLLLADEPTGSLDAKTSEEIFGLFRELGAGGKTVLIATHDPLARKYASVSLDLESGVLSETRVRHD